MSIIPNVRNRIKERIYMTSRGKTQEPELNAYWEGYLDETESREVGGYDYAVENMTNLLYFNAPVLADYASLLGLSVNEVVSIDGHKLLNTDKSILDMTAEELDQYTKSEITVQVFAEMIGTWLERNRDSLVTSLIESYSESEYKELVDRVENDGYQNYLIRLQNNDNAE